MNLRPFSVRLWLVLSHLALSLLGCSESESEGEHSNDDDIVADCQAIADACPHGVSGEVAEECHDISHDNEAEVCSDRKDECLDACTHPSIGGAGGGHDH